jgi:hypothetical protein
MVGLTAQATANLYALGAAALALWLVLRFPLLGPRTLKGAFILLACACCGLLVTAGATAAVEAVAGRVAALVGVYLPMLTFAFWTGFRLLRVTLTLFEPPSIG